MDNLFICFAKCRHNEKLLYCAFEFWAEIAKLMSIVV